ncbi:MAG TPA: sugar phosphate nucleotidyltransferase, partial [bacterium]|nr:sugar phosphate nucleotidyltransferase [bacterium]
VLDLAHCVPITQNIVIEPARRDTAPVIGLGAFHVYHRDPKAILASLHSDHVILQNETFLKLLKVAEDIAAKHDVIVTLGISPDHPATGYGYIASGKEFCKINGVEVFRVQNFTEKPNLPTAKAFLSAGNYFWNAGMFIARAEVLLAAYKQHTPQTYQFLSTIAAAIGTDREQATLEKIYPTIPKEPIDTAIMEKLNNIVVIPADIGWSDIGSWKAVKEILPKNAETNFVFGQHVGIDTENSLVYSSGSRLIATIGLKDMVIVESEDAILICPVSAAEKVKELVSMIKAEKRDSYL